MHTKRRTGWTVPNGTQSRLGMIEAPRDHPDSRATDGGLRTRVRPKWSRVISVVARVIDTRREVVRAAFHNN